jgi:hypothetical protein
MDPQRFDTLTKMIAAKVSRREMLKGLIGGFAGLAMGHRHWPTSAQGLSECVPPCISTAHCVDSKSVCFSGFFPCGGDPYEGGGDCCSPSQPHMWVECCDGRCTDVSRHPSHCGECGNACPQGRDCAWGECVCPDHRPECGGVCCERDEFCDPLTNRCIPTQDQ